MQNDTDLRAWWGAWTSASIPQRDLVCLAGKEFLDAKPSFRQALLIVIPAHCVEDSLIIGEALFPVIGSHERRGCFNFSS